MTRAVLIVNASKANADQREALRRDATATFAEAGWPEPRMLVTTEDDPGSGQARDAVRDGAELVVACGGDGTINAVAEALADTGVPLGVIPLGTGNLLATNLGIPTKTGDAIKLLTIGADRKIDVGGVCGVDGVGGADGADGTAGAVGNRVFTGMAGLGLDAAMVADAPDGLKKHIGWPAYLVSIARHLGDRGVDVELELDDVRIPLHRVRALIIGNVGHVQGGLKLLPDAVPDDGLLDVVALAPRIPLVGWLAVLVRLFAQRDRGTDTISPFQARHVVARTEQPIAQELDGEPFRTENVLEVRIRPGALTVRVPR